MISWFIFLTDLSAHEEHMHTGFLCNKELPPNYIKQTTNHWYAVIITIEKLQTMTIGFKLDRQRTAR